MATSDVGSYGAVEVPVLRPNTVADKGVKRRIAFFAMTSVVLVGAACILLAGPPRTELDEYDYYNDASMLRLRDDAYLSMLCDDSLKSAADSVVQRKLESIVLTNAEKLTHSDNTEANVNVVTRIAEEQFLYNRDDIRNLRLQVTAAISPSIQPQRLAAVGELQEKMTGHIMDVLHREAKKEINQMLVLTDEPRFLENEQKAELLSKTDNIMRREVEARVVRFINSRVEKASELAVNDAIARLKTTVARAKASEGIAAAGPAASLAAAIRKHTLHDISPQAHAAQSLAPAPSTKTQPSAAAAAKAAQHQSAAARSAVSVAAAALVILAAMAVAV
mmetsp:Transcript_13299/g.30623  ORF Transcript_13299/g.30623 Transcript_13299/m.30623 type:complete len:334 (-) Transcript_13299:39-1040(-)|eukprot:CAMPEP_0114554552 /NCGR_PEP_ID=MMETSP0114-20121206/8270_1 /TAXON_ID=31324 /ORGANISM="Goniomonas sp, Strain m" /LENGTH=333 /DNA_ID=CAMNT_0001739605 /DNA_START=19 /DNA_END=1020 /DNA_ORIENTATION=+